jgi:uncharacterized protein (TIGR02268 family)
VSSRPPIAMLIALVLTRAALAQTPAPAYEPEVRTVELLTRAALAQTPAPGCEPEVRTVVLSASPADALPEVCISPGRATALVFDSALRPESLQLERRERFLLVEAGARSILLVPAGLLRAGEPLRLTVRFADSAVPSAAEFRLVVHPTESTRQVDVFRHPRSADSLHEELRRLKDENARLHSALSRADSLVGLHASGLVRERGIAARTLIDRPVLHRSSALRLRLMFSQRSARSVAVVLDLENLDATRPWLPHRARLMAQPGELAMLDISPEPVPPGELRRIVIEAKALPAEAHGVYTLTLSDADGTRALTLHDVTFPDLKSNP